MVERATLFVSGMGWVEAYLDAVKIGDAVLEPGWSQWDARMLYSAHDVTEVLAAKGGEPVAVGLIMGKGWPGHLGHAITGKLVVRVTMRSGYRSCAMLIHASRI